MVSMLKERKRFSTLSRTVMSLPFLARVIGILSRKASMALDGRRAVRVERFDGLQPPGLTLGPLGFAPHDRLPIRRKDKPGPCIGDLDAIAAGFVDVKKERLLYRVFVRA